MLNLQKTRIYRDKEFPVAAGKSFTAEGMAVMSTIENNVEVVQPAAGSSGDVFIGFSYGDVFTPLTKAMVVDVVVPSSGTNRYVQLPKSNIVPTQIRAYDITGSNEIEETTVASGKFSCNDATGQLEFHSDEGGHTIRVWFRYYPTAAEVLAEDNVPIYKVQGADVLNQIGVILEGEVFTDQYDASVDWSAATSVETEATGLVTDSTGSGATIACTIIQIPSPDDPFLGLRFKMV